MAAEYPFIIGSDRRTSKIVKDIINPYTNELVAKVHYAEEVDVEEAIQVVQQVFRVTKVLPAYRRAEILENVSRILSNRKTELANLMTAESGKPITYSLAELDRAVFTFKYASEEAKRISGESIPLDLAAHSEKRFGIVRRFPIGPILAITPFNFSLNLVAHKVAPAIAAGNSIVLKPAPQAPLLAIILAEIVLEAGAPAGMLNVLPCSNELAEKMVRDERFKLITFTGSAKVGWFLKSIAGKKKVVLELGGNAGVIVDKSANIQSIVKRIALGAFGQAGQSCIKVQRIYVNEEIADEFIEKFLLSTKETWFGDPTKPETVAGPLIDNSAANRVEDWINEAVASGAKILTGGNRNGLVIEPTVIVGVKPDMKVVCEEIFGPVVTLHTFKLFEDAVFEINNSKYGLQAGVFSNDFKNIMFAFENLEVGAVVVNDFPTYRIDHMPYGGVKGSGIGREGLKYAIEEMTESKLLVLNLT
ncbi:MAG: aldehyde dehydrogenase family protein [Bacteroidota bacterium]|nr:aldehyde dehydrogenase family protein [Bacteroidota bacterium]